MSGYPLSVRDCMGKYKRETADSLESDEGDRV